MAGQGANFDDYDDIANVQIEEAFQRNKQGNVQLEMRDEDSRSNAAPYHILIDFQSMTEKDMRTRDTRNVRRKDLLQNGYFHFFVLSFRHSYSRWKLVGPNLLVATSHEINQKFSQLVAID